MDVDGAIYREGRFGHPKVQRRTLFVPCFQHGQIEDLCWLKRWKEDGTFEHLQSRILALADSQGLINWNYGAIDGSFSPWQGRR